MGMSAGGAAEYTVMTVLWGWELQWHKSTGWRELTTHQDVKKFASSCWACASATPTPSTPPMALRSTPERVWSEVQADFKGPVGGRYYFHVVIDQLSRWPEVEIVSSTSFDKLKPALERSWALLGIPDRVTHDNGPPYISQR